MSHECITGIMSTNQCHYMQAVRKLRSRLGKGLKHAYYPRPGEGRGGVRRPPVTHELVPIYTLQIKSSVPNIVPNRMYLTDVL